MRAAGFSATIILMNKLRPTFPFLSAHSSRFYFDARRGLSRLASLAAASALAMGCGGASNGELPTSVTRRSGSVVVDGCTLDAGQQSALRATTTRQVLSEVVLLCLSMQDDGAIGFRDGASAPQITAEITELRNQGYKVSLGVTAVDASDVPFTPQHLATLFAQPAWRTQAVAGVVSLAGMVDGIQFAPPQLLNTSRADVSAFVTALSQGVRPAKSLGIFAPPSVTDPSDVTGGDAFDVRTLAPLVDRVRLMTLDYSCCDVPPGPTIDAGWAIDAANLAMPKLASSAQLDVAMPLYGTDFTAPDGQNSIAQASVNYDEALALAAQYQKQVGRGAGDAPNFAYRDAKGNQHQVFFDDTRSTLRTLATWTADALPASVGVVFYGLGAEDPTLWANLAQAEK